MCLSSHSSGFRPPEVYCPASALPLGHPSFPCSQAVRHCAWVLWLFVPAFKFHIMFVSVSWILPALCFFFFLFCFRNISKLHQVCIWQLHFGSSTSSSSLHKRDTIVELIKCYFNNKVSSSYHNSLNMMLFIGFPRHISIFSLISLIFSLMKHCGRLTKWCRWSLKS